MSLSSLLRNSYTPSHAAAARRLLDAAARPFWSTVTGAPVVQAAAAASKKPASSNTAEGDQERRLITSTAVVSAPERISTQDIVKVIAETHDLSQAESKRILNTVLDTIVDALAQKKTVALSKFGSFEAYTSKSRMGRNPSTGQQMMVPEKERIRFKAFSDLKDSVQDKPEEETKQ